MIVYRECPVAKKEGCLCGSFKDAFRDNAIVDSGNYVHCIRRIGQYGAKCKLYLINECSSTKISRILEDPEALENIIKHGVTRPLKKGAPQAENKGETFKNTIK